MGIKRICCDQIQKPRWCSVSLNSQDLKRGCFMVEHKVSLYYGINNLISMHRYLDSLQQSFWKQIQNLTSTNKWCLVKYLSSACTLFQQTECSGMHKQMGKCWSVNHINSCDMCWASDVIKCEVNITRYTVWIFKSKCWNSIDWYHSGRGSNYFLLLKTEHFGKGHICGEEKELMTLV